MRGRSSVPRATRPLTTLSGRDARGPEEHANSSATAAWQLDRFAGRARWRRRLVLILVLATTAVGLALMWRIVAARGPDILKPIFLPCFALLFAWIALSFWSGFLGFLLGLLRRHPVTLRRHGPADGPIPPLTERTAILIPVYNEDAEEVSGRISVMYRSLQDTGHLDTFDFFILSDTNKADLAREEESTYAGLRERLDAGPRLFYRRRPSNTGKKAGNVAEWVETRGHAYAFMIVLDADSLLHGDTMVRLAALMQANPHTGLIQTHTVPAGRETLFARALQFSSRLVGVLLSMGFSFWQTSESNYFGHNAILRVKAFAECCRLPVLSGRPPLGGEILSHDFVEAAFLRRGGWYCWMLPELRGSYEELPTNLLDYAVRDRRWMQGNLQHARLIGKPGLHPMSRLHLGLGIFAYLASPLWLAMLMLSSAMVVDQRITGDIFFGPTRTLFPQWPQYHWPEIHGLLGLTIGLLLGPKLLALILRFGSTRSARRFGGRIALMLSFVAETCFSTLLAPVMMLFHTTFLIRILAGSAVGWPPQARGDRGMDWRQALTRHIGHVLFGLAALVALGAIVPDYVPWILPVVIGLLLSVPLAVLSSRRTLGLAARRLRLFLTPEERAEATLAISH
ncbi:glucans biosynthesis glucosyltransferase MdoH [Reyranella sp.]|uniref:glucans biosynthesis glucosyltransferase MdoH n=1 Tax=Reyranella sp. TaxID=1929291 RepID=UPI003D0D85AF